MSHFTWWQAAVFYQIYPRSFADGNGDGIGDFQGMINKLDYLKSLGIDGIWLSPHFPSPQFDCGYDIADYTGVDPQYGNLEEFQRFLDGCHARGMKVILDLVLNHTSHEHPWFLESRSSRDNPKRDWYVWREGKNGGPPNNWYSTFGGSAWEVDPQTDQYYYHFFFKEQPDLNWRNPEVHAAMMDAIRFWLKLGVDGFRLDAIGTIYEDPRMLDHPVKESLIELRKQLRAASDEKERRKLVKKWRAMFQYQSEQAGMHELLQEIRKVVNEYDDRMTVAESEILEYMGDGSNQMHMVFNFPLLRTEKLTPAWIRKNQKERLAGLKAIHPDAWPCNTLGNHDSGRVYTRWGDGEHNDALARTNLAMLLTLKGTPFLYNGEEIGMSDLMLSHIEQFRDLLGVWAYHAMVDEMGLAPAEALLLAAHNSRDKNRTPMQWRNAPNAGFSPEGVQTWLPVHPNYAQGINVADQDEHPDSLLNFYRAMIALRKTTPALVTGEYRAIHPKADQYLAYLRQTTKQKVLVALNYSDQKLQLDFSTLAKAGKLLFSTQENRHFGQLQPVDLKNCSLAPYEAIVIELPR